MIHNRRQCHMHVPRCAFKAIARCDKIYCLYSLDKMQHRCLFALVASYLARMGVAIPHISSVEMLQKQQ